MFKDNDHRITTAKDDHDQTIHNEKLIANQFNKYFTEIGARLSSQIENITPDFSHYLAPMDCEFQFTEISDLNVFNQ